MLLVSLGNVESSNCLTSDNVCMILYDVIDGNCVLSRCELWRLRTQHTVWSVCISFCFWGLVRRPWGWRRWQIPLRWEGAAPDPMGGDTVGSWGNGREMGTFLLRNGLVWMLETESTVCMSDIWEGTQKDYAVVVNGWTFFSVFYLIFEDYSQVLLDVGNRSTLETAWTDCTNLRCYKEIVDELSTLVVPSSVEIRHRNPSNSTFTIILFDAHFLNIP